MIERQYGDMWKCFYVSPLLGDRTQMVRGKDVALVLGSSILPGHSIT